jgi:hypothetical protein
MAAVFNLNHHATYLHWHFINVSLSNVLVVAVMLVVFVLAIVVPFPGRHTTGAAIAPTPPAEQEP